MNQQQREIKKYIQTANITVTLIPLIPQVRLWQLEFGGPLDL